MNQRWLEGRSTYRPPAERIRPAEYDVALIDDDNTPKAFIEQHHYSRSYPAARVRLGLYRRGAFVGTAVFSHPCNDRVLTKPFAGIDARAAVELGRFVLLDEVPGNGETWFLARCFEQLRARGFVGVVSFSDPTPRTALDGRIVFPGHVGTIYQAHNAIYLGRGAAGLVRLLPDGTVFSHRTEQKIRAGHRGWRAGVAVLEGFGAESLAPDAPAEDRRAWLAQWLGTLTRPLRHPGNHKYAWSLSRAIALPAGLAFPKALAA